MHRDSSAISALVLVVLLVTAACGTAAAPTVAPAIPAATQSTAPNGGLAPTAAPSPGVPEILNPAAGYAPERVRELLAEGFYLGGTTYTGGKEPQYGGSAVFTHRLDLPSADPSMTTTISLNRVTSPLTGKGHLVRQKPSNVFEPQPYLATRWDISDDFKSWTFHLRQDVKWHDGVQFTAEDIKFWIELSIFPPPGRRATYTDNFGPVKEVQVVDKFTVRLIEKEPMPFLWELLVANAYMAHPKHLAEPAVKSGNPKVDMTALGWVSLGPFKFDSYDAGSRFKVVRNPLYFEKDDKGRSLPYLDGIEFPIIPDTTAIVAAFRTGRTDATARGSGYGLTPTHVALIKKSLKDKAWFPRYPYTGWGPNLNALAPPFNDINVRRAVNLYVDREKGMKLVWDGFAVESGLMVPGSFWANPDVQTWPGFNRKTKAQDQAEAKRLLQQSGYQRAKVEILCRDNFAGTCEFMDIEFRELGLDSSIRIVDTNLVGELTRNGNFQVNVQSGAGSLPGSALSGFLTTNPLNSYKHGDTKIDQYDRQIQETLDPQLRRKLLWEAEYYILVDKAYRPMWFREENVLVYRTHIKGVWVPGASPSDNNAYETAWYDPSAR